MRPNPPLNHQRTTNTPPAGGGVCSAPGGAEAKPTDEWSTIAATLQRFGVSARKAAELAGIDHVTLDAARAVIEAARQQRLRAGWVAMTLADPEATAATVGSAPRSGPSPAEQAAKRQAQELDEDRQYLIDEVSENDRAGLLDELANANGTEPQTWASALEDGDAIRELARRHRLAVKRRLFATPRASATPTLQTIRTGAA